MKQYSLVKIRLLLPVGFEDFLLVERLLLLLMLDIVAVGATLVAGHESVLKSLRESMGKETHHVGGGDCFNSSLLTSEKLISVGSPYQSS